MEAACIAVMLAISAAIRRPKHRNSPHRDGHVGLARHAADRDADRHGAAGVTDSGISAFTCTKPAVDPGASPQ